MIIHESAEMVQLLRPDGTRVEADPVDGWTPRCEADPDTLVQWWADMVIGRRIDTEATALQRQGQLGLWPPSHGQEAAQVATARAVRGQDMIFPTYREHAMGWVMGLDPVELCGLFRGVDMGAWDPEALRFALYTLVIGSQTLHATGYAMGLQRDAADAAVVACFGDGASSQGDVNEAFVFAASASAPVVFLCQNNQWAISEPVGLQARRPIAERARGFGFPGVRVDGNDVLAMHAVMTRALERARAGEGPTLVEAVTYRMGAHTTSDDPTKYRSEDEVEEWRRRDPILRLERHLEATGALDAATRARIEAEADAVAERMRREVPALVAPPLAETFGWVYASGSDDLDAQRAEHEAWLAGFTEDAGGRA